ncbi:hypothetical protein N7533_011836 [Penicillium manginii]|uniref:uncharacterized protein n=1 Tax=Penicillium manginii TaxID=203109 RepID=UPI002548ECDB|nr:uncharacterized protein N7533_011836 [Penicillium manginii]KAJ5739052.1 hypothetical protein N7533_011836 [Penicillium manginii]
MAPGKSLADQLAELEDPTPKDIERDGNSSDEEAGKPAESNAGREHYQAVGKGKLRKQDPVSLGKQYDGSRVSRDAIDADSDDDPFAARSDDDVEESDELESGDEGAAVSDEEGSDLEGSAGSDDQSDGSEDVEDSEDEITSDDEESSAPRKPSASKKQSGSKETSADDREELRRLMATDQKTIAATISQASKADAAKGKAVKEQRATFDALLNTRIKLQKGLTAINDIAGIAAEDEDAQEEDASNSEAIKSAESAALALWSTLEELRTALAEAQSKDETKKRKRSSVTPSTTSASLWERMADLESESLSHRRSVLDKWSSKVRGAPSSLPNARGKLLGSASGQQTITAVLDAHVATEIGDRSSKRARHATETTEPIYDDTIFYQSLLRELVEQRMSSSEAMSGGLDSLTQLPSRLPIHPVTGMRNDKVKRDIDTRASKGRKMKYNVHEKLQNFMAPEDRGGWTIRARDEFFASLLGRTASGLLGEGDDSGSDAESDDDREEGGLQLFRS